MTQKAKLEIVKQEEEVVKQEPEAEVRIDFQTIDQLIGRPAEQKANRIIFKFPDAKVECKKPNSVFKRMLELANKK